MCDLKICFDREAPKNPNIIMDGMDRMLHMWGLKTGWWEDGQVITYKFLDRDKKHEEEMISVFREIESFANVKYVEAETDTVLRITFNPKLGSWSYIGNDNKFVSKDKPNMNIGWFGRGTKRHECGHHLGAGHEHQQPIEPIKWNKERVYEIMAGAPNFWDRKKVDWNFFRVYNQDQSIGTKRDPLSIMMYPIAKEMTLDGFSTTANQEFSVLDKQFLGTEIYPLPDKKVDPEVTKALRAIAILNTDKKILGKNSKYMLWRYGKMLTSKDVVKGMSKAQLIDTVWSLIEEEVSK